ncbi:uncharacterized protein LOC123299917 [Chrysoperla carnea]|uniref:uncharacterized protein LOC123299917 n=1 Tax=Chrysoperla carnea TaxID=189513 RepID=UPI001D06BAA1|nr:uncharacterized protein LOC123299917 [Chrysoperla carnea]
MKVFVTLTCLLAITSASLIASPYSVLLQPQHLPVIDANGVPVEPLVNQAARVQHAQLRAAAQIRNGDAALLGAPLAIAAPHGIAAPAAIAGPLALSAHGAILAAPQHLPAIDGNGVPVEPLANQIARAQNAAAHANAQLRNGDLHSILGRKKRSLVAAPWAAAAWAAPQHLPIIDSNGVPVEPLVNQAARVQHAQLRAAAQIRNGDAALLGAPLALAGAHGIAAPAPLALAAHGAIYGAPLLDANSVPIEPLANQIVRAQNVAAHVNANIRTGDLHGVLGRKKRSLLAAPWAAAAWAAPQHLPIIDSNGVPVEPLVNQAARVQHAQLRAAAQIRNGDVALLGAPALALGGHGLALGAPAAIAAAGPLAVAGIPALASISHAGRVPIDTPDVAAVRAAHFAAHARAAGRSGALVLAPGYAVIPESRTYPALAPDGQPIETPEVQILKANHLAAHAEARARNGAAPLFLAQQLYAGPLAVVAPNGVPIDTPEVQAARAAHFAAKAAALAIVPH